MSVETTSDRKANTRRSRRSALNAARTAAGAMVGSRLNTNPADVPMRRTYRRIVVPTLTARYGRMNSAGWRKNTRRVPEKMLEKSAVLYAGYMYDGTYAPTPAGGEGTGGRDGADGGGAGAGGAPGGGVGEAVGGAGGGAAPWTSLGSGDVTWPHVRHDAPPSARYSRSDPGQRLRRVAIPGRQGTPAIRGRIDVGRDKDAARPASRYRRGEPRRFLYRTSGRIEVVR